MFWCGIVCAFFSAPRLSLDDVGRDDGYDGGADVVVVLATTTVVEEKLIFLWIVWEQQKDTNPCNLFTTDKGNFFKKALKKS